MRMKIEKYVVIDIETTGLDPWYGDIVTCICAKSIDSGGQPQIFAEVNRGNELHLLSDFFTWLNPYLNEYTLITKNGMSFDIPFILTRWIMLSSDKVPTQILNIPHFDIQRITYKWISLEDISKLYGLKGKTGNGVNAINLFKNNRLQELKSYCLDDVNLTHQVFLKYTQIMEGN